MAANRINETLADVRWDGSIAGANYGGVCICTMGGDMPQCPVHNPQPIDMRIPSRLIPAPVTTNWACRECGASLNSRTALSHVCPSQGHPIYGRGWKCPKCGAGGYHICPYTDETVGTIGATIDPYTIEKATD